MPRRGATGGEHQIATNRFCEHQPYYRQEQHFLLRHGVHLPRGLQSQWMGELARDWLSGIYRAMHEEMLGEDYLQVDEPSEARQTGALATCPAGVRPEGSIKRPSTTSNPATAAPNKATSGP